MIAEPFQKLYSEDKSKNHENSSRIMWAIALVCDTESKYFNLPDKEKRKIIARDYLKDDKFDFSKYREQMDLYEQLIFTSGQRQLSIWKRKMDEKTELLSHMVYSVDSAEFIEKLLVSNTKLFAELERISEQLVKEGESGIVKGGSEESASEKGDI